MEEVGAGVGSGRVGLCVKFALQGESSTISRNWSGRGGVPPPGSQPEMPEPQTHMANTQATPAFCRERLGKDTDREG